MFGLKCFQAAGVCLAMLGFGFTATDAQAGSCNSNRSYNSGHHYNSGYNHGYNRHSNHGSVSYSNNNYRVQVSYNSGGHYNSGNSYNSGRRYQNSNYCSTPRVQVVQYQQPSGYWKQVYVQPVYEIRYRACGTAYRVCVRAGYYDRVWISYRH